MMLIGAVLQKVVSYAWSASCLKVKNVLDLTIQKLQETVLKIDAKLKPFRGDLITVVLLPKKELLNSVNVL